MSNAAQRAYEAGVKLAHISFMHKLAEGLPTLELPPLTTSDGPATNVGEQPMPSEEYGPPAHYAYDHNPSADFYQGRYIPGIQANTNTVPPMQAEQSGFFDGLGSGLHDLYSRGMSGLRSMYDSAHGFFDDDPGARADPYTFDDDPGAEDYAGDFVDDPGVGAHTPNFQDDPVASASASASASGSGSGSGYTPYQVPGQQFPGMAEAGRGTASNFTAVKGGYGKQLAALKQHFAANGQAGALDGLTYQDMARAMGNRGLRPGDRFDADALLQNMRNRQDQNPAMAGVSPLEVQRRQGQGTNQSYKDIGTFQTLQQQRAAATRNSAPANVNPFGGLRGAGPQRQPNFNTNAGAAQRPNMGGMRMPQMKQPNPGAKYR